jgi:hypothetical protein
LFDRFLVFSVDVNLKVRLGGEISEADVARKTLP